MPVSSMEPEQIVRGLWLEITIRTAQGEPLSQIAADLGIDRRRRGSCVMRTPIRTSRSSARASRKPHIASRLDIASRSHAKREPGIA